MEFSLVIKRLFLCMLNKCIINSYESRNDLMHILCCLVSIKTFVSSSLTLSNPIFPSETLLSLSNPLKKFSYEDQIITLSLAVNPILFCENFSSKIPPFILQPCLPANEIPFRHRSLPLKVNIFHYAKPGFSFVSLAPRNSQ